MSGLYLPNDTALGASFSMNTGSVVNTMTYVEALNLAVLVFLSGRSAGSDFSTILAVQFDHIWPGATNHKKNKAEQWRST